MTCVLAKPMKIGDTAHDEGEIVHLDEDTAKNLIEAGMVRDATDEDLMGEDEEEEGSDGEEVPADEPVTNAVRRLAANNEATLVKATEKVAEKLVKASRVQPNMGRHVAGSDEDRTGGFKDIGDYAFNRMSAAKGDFKAMKKVERYKSLVRTKFSPASMGVVSTAGGDMVPIQWAENLWKLSFKNVVDLLGQMTKYDMRYQQEKIPAYVQPSAAESITATVTAEGDAITPSVGVTSTVTLDLVKGTVLVNITDELERFTPYHISTVIESVAPERIRYLTNNSVVNGTNSGINLIGNAASVVVPASNAGRIEYADVVAMEAALFDEFGGDDAAWYCNKATIPELMTIGFPNRSASFQTPAWAAGGFGDLLGPKPKGSLLGRPVWTLENFPLKGTKGALVLANLKSLAAGYSGLIADQTPFLYFNQAIGTWRFLFYFNSVNPLTVPYVRQFGGPTSNIVVLSNNSST